MQRMTQRLLNRLAPHGLSHDRHQAAKNAREFRLGILGGLFVAALLLATAVIYLVPFGKASYTADLVEANSVKVGDQVRLAGITVGSVTALELGETKVRMTFTVDRDVFLGDATSLEIRMLTAVGGHYVAVFPSGTEALGSRPIPPDRVRLPYSLVRILQDAAAPVSEVDGETLRQNLAALQQSLDTSPDALRQLGAATQSFVDILRRQNLEVSRALTVMDEYLRTIDGNKSLIGTFVRELGTLMTVGLGKRAEIASALTIAASLLSRIAAVEPSWREVLAPLAGKLRELLPQLEQLAAQLDVAIPQWQQLRERLVAMTATEDGVVIDQSALTAPVCIPLPGWEC
ncbi:phospholipid/cholesterol/gamma-HCH transport system substrate-binding protein [Nocardia amikacinitolerans]|uniref:MlaD family protein n=1 Tax=Nocardia amikacinitolerans TaxID=756689 RepID=UPI0009FBB25A|nr:MlaD family protein [Nocardia amikacinitolerans]MCP2314766.1 phospholipid/cholesterol/gamma-HCH transport system substrate-binding protein [Nocardia amikacinitolerans]